MKLGELVKLTSKFTPVIVGLTTVGLAFVPRNNAWAFPSWLVAASLGILAAAIFVRGHRNALRGLTQPMEKLGFKRNRDQLWFAMAAKGMPNGYLVVAFIAWLGLLFSQFRFPYLAVAIAGAFLTLAWGFSNRRCPIDSSCKD